VGKSFWGLCLVIIFLLVAISNPAISKVEKRRRALVIGLDGTTGPGLNYRALVQGKAPALAALMRGGKFTPCSNSRDTRCARAHSGPHTGEDFRWVTGPGWCSVLTGVDNKKHGVKDNAYKNLSVFSQTSLKHPTFMKRLISKGMKTAAGGVATFMSATKNGKIIPGIIDYECGADAEHKPLTPASSSSSCNLTARQASDGKDNFRDENLTRFLEAEIANPSIDLAMGVFDKIDATGHWNGFSNNKIYLKSISSTDILVARLIQAIEKRVQNEQEEWLVIVTADHGGHNVFFGWGLHDTVEWQDNAIPFIIKTFGSDYPLNELTYPVTHMDVHPTLMEWFGLPQTADIDGHPQAI
jgi:hypothetical protein